jgi:hypothetical protein
VREDLVAEVVAKFIANVPRQTRFKSTMKDGAEFEPAPVPARSVLKEDWGRHRHWLREQGVLP